MSKMIDEDIISNQNFPTHPHYDTLSRSKSIRWFWYYYHQVAIDERLEEKSKDEIENNQHLTLNASKGFIVTIDRKSTRLNSSHYAF